MKIKYIVLCLLLALIGCQRDEEMQTVKLEVKENVEPGYNSVTISCAFVSNVTIDGVAIKLSTTHDFSQVESHEMTQLNGKYTIDIDDLRASTTYYVQYSIITPWLVVDYKQISEFQTLNEPTLATVITYEPSSISYTSAIVAGEVVQDGGAIVTDRGVCYSTSPNPTISDFKVTNGVGVGYFTCELMNLQSHTIYYICAYAVNEKGVVYGDVKSFATKAQAETAIETILPTNITDTSAVVGGVVTDDGGVSIIERGVVYSTSQNPTMDDSKVINGSGLGKYTCTLTNLQRGVTYYFCAYATNAVGSTVCGEVVSFTTMQLKGGEGLENGCVYMDLGLSVKWATMNVGACKPEDYGDYFAWGETTTKSTYKWSTYKWCNGSETTLTKYNTDSTYGHIIDYKTQLQLSDDVAHVQWGGAWRMPTEAEWYELLLGCIWTWTSQNSINGYKVTSKSNGCSIFLPAAGYRFSSLYEESSSSLSRAGSWGRYWSRTLNTYSPSNAVGMNFDSSEVIESRYLSGRYRGLSVRPVCP